jgi:hypothetical protein
MRVSLAVPRLRPIANRANDFEGHNGGKKSSGGFILQPAPENVNPHSELQIAELQ